MLWGENKIKCIFEYSWVQVGLFTSRPSDRGDRNVSLATEWSNEKGTPV